MEVWNIHYVMSFTATCILQKRSSAMTKNAVSFKSSVKAGNSSFYCCFLNRMLIEYRTRERGYYEENVFECAVEETDYSLIV
jgi:hypothetical protein